MSSALLKKSLEIVETDHKTKGSKNKKNKGLFDLIPENYSKVKSKGAGGKIEKRAVYSIHDRSSKRRKDTPKDSKSLLEENLKKLNTLASSSLNEDIAKKLVKRAQTGKPLVEIEKVKKEEGTVFTEEDFKNFEKDLTY